MLVTQTGGWWEWPHEPESANQEPKSIHHNFLNLIPVPDEPVPCRSIALNSADVGVGSADQLFSVALLYGS